MRRWFSGTRARAARCAGASLLFACGVMVTSCGAPRLSIHPKGTALEDSAAGAPAPARSRVSAGVKAGSADDNVSFNAFLSFLERYGHLGERCDVSQRIVVAVRDRNGLPLADAEVVAYDGGREILRRRTYADGRTLLFPSEVPALGSQSARIRVRYGSSTQETLLSSAQGHQLNVQMPLGRETFSRVPLDIAFVLDTTGSMGDEIAQLKKTLEYINFQITSLAPAPDVRFAMVLYRDKGDEYRTQMVPFTSDVKHFASVLDKVKADGGNDTPEDVQQALGEAINTLTWRSTGAKLAFLIGDAPPHLDYGQSFTYVRAMNEAALRGIKITAIGASGLDQQGEVVWRQIAQYTMAPFVFLTRGETGDSEGSASSVSHHVGANWVAENLDAIIIRMVKVELANYSPKGNQPSEDYFAASWREGVKSADVMDDLFHQSVKQLVDYAVQRLADRTPTMVLPVKAALPKLQALAQKVESRIAVSLSRAPEFQLVERRDLSAVIKLQSEQLADKYDSERAVELGKLLPAKLVVLSRLEQSASGEIEVLIKLVRLESGEILSLSLLKVDPKLVA